MEAKIDISYPAIEKQTADKPTDKPTADKPTTNKPAINKPKTDKNNAIAMKEKQENNIAQSKARLNMDDGIDMSLYKEEMLRLAGQTSAQGHLIAPQAQADKVSKLCGSKIHVELCLGQDKKQVSEFAYEIEACVLGQASAALLAEKIIGTSPDELRGLAKAMDKMLKDNVPIKKERWLGFSLFQSVHHYPMRHSSTYLAFEAVEDCLGQLGA